MSWRRVAALALVLLMLGCAPPGGLSPSASDGPRTRCLNSPGRGESYSSDRPLILFLCVESP